MKKWHYGAMGVVVLATLLAIFSTGATPAETAPYFSENASVMYFYSERCHWCQEQKTVLLELGEEGYRVKPMDVGRHPDYWEQYGISGTPTFIAKNGEKLSGFQTRELLEAFLEKHGSRS